MGAEDFVREVYAASYRRLVIQVYAVAGDVGEAEDAVQEAFVKALGRGRSFASLHNPEAWLRTVALNQLRNRWRHAEVVRRFQGRLAGSPTHLELTPDHVALVEALRSLDDAHRTTVALYYLADLTVADVAMELGIPEGTVKTRLARSRELLAPMLSGEETDHV
jgi:RNA polymerase sigma factor (sigma-70 family)